LNPRWNKRKPTPSQILKLCNEIAQHLKDGWSINIAKRRVLGPETRIIYKCVTASDAYLAMLNAYSKERQINITFYRNPENTGRKILPRRSTPEKIESDGDVRETNRKQHFKIFK
jgi:hypothetical protein